MEIIIMVLAACAVLSLGIPRYALRKSKTRKFRRKRVVILDFSHPRFPRD